MRACNPQQSSQPCHKRSSPSHDTLVMLPDQHLSLYGVDIRCRLCLICRQSSGSHSQDIHCGSDPQVLQCESEIWLTLQLEPSVNAMRRYIGYTVTQLMINSRSTEIIVDLQSPQARSRADAGEAERLSASVAAAAAIAPGNWNEAAAKVSVHYDHILK